METEGANLLRAMVDCWYQKPGKVVKQALGRVMDTVVPLPLAESAIVRAIELRLTSEKVARVTRQGISAVHAEVAPAFTDLTHGWQVLGDNSERGLSNASFWARDPQGQRVMIKIQNLPEGSANERLAFSLGTALGLPVNEVQLGLWEGQVVSLHRDVAREGEQALAIVDLALQERLAATSDPRLAQMELFDQVIQNTDRNPRNILVVKPRAGESTPLRLYLIDHTNAFGVGRLPVSLLAAKFKLKGLAWVYFSPDFEARAFGQYLAGLPPEQWTKVRPLLERFGALTDKQIDVLLQDVHGLLPPEREQLIRRPLQLKRNIANALSAAAGPPAWLLQPQPGPRLGGVLTSPARNAVQHLRHPDSEKDR